MTLAFRFLRAIQTLQKRGSIGRDIGRKRGSLMHVAVVKATFYEDARVWYVESSDIEGLHVEGDTFGGVPPQRCGRRRRPPRRRRSWGSPHRDQRARLPPGSRS